MSGSPRFARPDTARSQLSPRNAPPFSPCGRAPLRPSSAIRPDGRGQSPRRSFMGPCAPLVQASAPKPTAATARPKKKKGPDPHWMTSNDVMHIDFVKKGMVKHLAQFNVPPLPEGVAPQLTPQQREKLLLQKGPDELAADLKGRTLYSDIFNANPPPEGYFEDALLQPAEPQQEMLPGDDRPRWKN